MTLPARTSAQNGHATNGTVPTPKPKVIKRIIHVAPGLVRPDELYTLGEFCKRINVGRWGIRRMREDGLKTLKYGGRTYVRGQEFFEFLESQEQQE